MFTKSDYEDYFNDIEKKEKAMVNYVEKVVSQFKDKSIRETLNNILDEEKMHCNLVKGLFKYL